MLYPNIAYTLIEMLLSLILLSIVCLSVLPTWQELIEQSYLTTYAHRLLGALNYARNNAICLHAMVTICPTKKDQTNCGQDWTQGYSLFIDKEGNGINQADNRLIKTYPSMIKGFSLDWRGFPKQYSLSFHPSGYTLEQDGSFYLCPMLHPLHLARKIIVSKSGRARLVIQTCPSTKR